MSGRHILRGLLAAVLVAASLQAAAVDALQLRAHPRPRAQAILWRASRAG